MSNAYRKSSAEKSAENAPLDAELIAELATEATLWTAQVATAVRKARRARVRYLKNKDPYHLGAWQAIGSLLVEYGADPKKVEQAITGESA